MKRLISLTIVASLLMISPGPHAYAAVARVGAVSGNLSGAQGAAGAFNQQATRTAVPVKLDLTLGVQGIGRTSDILAAPRLVSPTPLGDTEATEPDDAGLTLAAPQLTAPTPLGDTEATDPDDAGLPLIGGSAATPASREDASAAAASPEAAGAIEAATPAGKTVRRSASRVLKALGWDEKKAAVMPETLGIQTQAGPSLNKPEDAKPEDQAKAKDEDAPPAPKAESEDEAAAVNDDHLLYDIHEGYFKAGYVAAGIYQAGAPLELPKVKKSFGRKNTAERGQFINGLGYRIAELRQDENAGRKFIDQAKEATDEGINALLSKSLQGMDTDHQALRQNLQDGDFVQGYLTGMSWRPGKQLLMPAPTFTERLKLGLRKRMQARDEQFMKGLYASLGKTNPEAAAAIRSKLADGPAVGHRDFGTKLGYVLHEVLEPGYDKAFDKKVPYLPGRIRIPKSLIGLVVGHTIFIMFGIYMHISAQPYLVYGLTGSKTMMGVIRNVHFGAYSASSFLPIGPTIDKTDYRTMFIWTSVVRALLMGLIPLLFFSGYMTFGVLIAIVAINPMFQSLMTNSDTASRDSFLGTDEHVVREGNAFATKISAISGLVIPAAAAWFVSQLVVAFGSPAGYAAAYAGYGAMLLISVPFFYFMVRDPRYHDPAVKHAPSKNPLQIFMPLWTVMKLPYYFAKWALSKIAEKRGKASDAEVIKGRAEMLAAAKEREVPYQEGRRFKNLREKIARAFDKIEATQGVSVILRSDTLSLLVAITAIELFIADALMFVLIPNYIIDVIRPMASLASAPIIGSMLTTPVGIMGIMLTAGAIGRYMGTRLVSGPKGAKRIKKWGHKAFYWGAGISGLTFWGMLIPTFFVSASAPMSIPLFAGSMAVLLASEFFMMLLATPLAIAMSPVRRKQIPNDMVGKVSAAFTMVDVGLMAAGALAMGILIDIVAIQTAVIIIAAAITGTSILEFFAPRWLRNINPEGWENGERERKQEAADKAEAKKAAEAEKAAAKPDKTAFNFQAAPIVAFA